MAEVPLILHHNLLSNIGVTSISNQLEILRRQAVKLKVNINHYLCGYYEIRAFDNNIINRVRKDIGGVITVEDQNADT